MNNKNLVTHSDTSFMQYALALARRGIGNTAPNPSVGCVIVKEGKILGASHTAKNGRPHAETIALSMAGNEAKGATAYVTLEPCAHHGQTPPCAEALINAGITKVVIAVKDPFAAVNGKGIEMLENAGIEVITGLCESEALQINEGFFSVQNKGRPFITLKTATSLDGKIALQNGSSKWITGDESREYVHLMRSRTDAIITGIATIIADDPILNCRLPGIEQHSPVRVILDSNLNIPLTCKLAQTAKDTPCWLMTIKDTISANPDKVHQLEQLGVKIIPVNRAGNGKICMDDAFAKLGLNGINNAMIEAGATINSAALRLGLVDRIAWFRAPTIIGNDGLAAFLNTNIERLSDSYKFIKTETKFFGSDTLEIFNAQ